MRYSILMGAVLPLALACDTPGSDPCAAAFVASQASANAFCGTFTKSVVTATTGLPAWASACSSKTKKISSACSCFATGAVVATSAPVVPTSTAKLSTLVTVVKSTSSAAPVKTSSTVKASSAASVKATSTSKAVVTSAPAATGSACVVTAYAGISSAVKSCTNIVLSNVSAPPSSTIDLTGLQTGAVVTFAGKTTFGTTLDNDFDPIVISGHSVTITGAAGHVIDGNGAAYWDGQGSNGGGDKPDHFIVLKKMYNSKVNNLNIVSWPVHLFDITGCQGLVVSNLVLDNSAGDAPNSLSDGDPAAHNSDGFDISSSDSVTLQNINVHNQDDCVAVTSGSNIIVDNIYCYGGHGLSIGSVGGKSNNTVDGVIFSNSQIVDSENGARIKTNSGTTGTINNVTYRNITMSGISDYGIDVQQDYLNGGPTGEPTNGVIISDITFEDVTGTVTSDAKDYYILCGSGSCSDFTFTGVSITGGKGDSCNYPTSSCP